MIIFDYQQLKILKINAIQRKSTVHSGNPLAN
jgi:hypothetical protein